MFADFMPQIISSILYSLASAISWEEKRKGHVILVGLLVFSVDLVISLKNGKLSWAQYKFRDSVASIIKTDLFWYLATIKIVPELKL